MKAEDYLIALKVVREIQRTETKRFGSPSPWLAQTLHSIELYCPLDFSSTGARKVRELMNSAYSGKL